MEVSPDLQVFRSNASKVSGKQSYVIHWKSQGHIRASDDIHL